MTPQTSSAQSHECRKRECYFCYEMNRDKSERNLVMPRVKPMYNKPTGYKVPLKRVTGNGTSRNIVLDPETGEEMYYCGVSLVTGYSYKHVVSMFSGNKDNFTGLIRVA